MNRCLITIFCLILSEYINMQGVEYFNKSDAQHERLINNYKNIKNKHGMGM
jgi:hypothetical protein